MIRLFALVLAGLAASTLVQHVRRAPVRARARRLGKRGHDPTSWFGGVRRRPGRHSRRPAPAAVVGFDVALLTDLVRSGILAGLNPFLALVVAAEAGGAPELGDPDDLTRALRSGSSFEDALSVAARRAPSLGPLLALLASSTRSGAPLAPALERLSASARRSARLALATRARSVPVRLLFPLVFLGLPAFGLLALAPVVLSSPLF
ncbi:MAG: type II secretion system F family protein [Acidimicrobiia bacterium]